MPMTVGDVKKFVLHTLQKSPGYSGFYTDDKCNIAIQEALDFISTKMMVAGGGLMKKIAFIDTNTTDDAYPLPAGCALVDTVRYKSTTVYMPIEYSDDYMTPQVDGDQATQFPAKYRLLGNMVYFNPRPTTVGERCLQIEYQGYPAWITDDEQNVDPDFDRAMCWYAKYRAATILVVNNGGTPRWGGAEEEWKTMVDLIIHKRIRKPRFVKEFME